jgi:hypothetical protein
VDPRHTREGRLMAGQFDPPLTPIIDVVTGSVTEIGRRYLEEIGNAVGGLAPIDAHYFLGTPAAALTSGVNLGALASGYLKIAVGVGVATPSTVATIPEADVTGLVAALAVFTAALALITSGTYTPALTNVANLSASTPFSCQWSRVGATVTVSGRVDVDPITTATDTQLGIALPIASVFANANECAGSAWAPTLTSEGAAVLADVANHRATLQWKAVDVTNAARYFSFTYRVI